LATFANIALDPLFIFGLEWGCGGAAAATVVAQGLGVALILARLHGKRRKGEFGDAAQALRWHVLFRVLRGFVTIAGVMIARNWGKVFCFTFLARQAALQGPLIAAAYSLTFQVGFATSQVAESLATSTQVLLAKVFRSCGNADRPFAPLPASRASSRIVQRGLQAGLILSGLLGGLTLLGQAHLLQAMTSDVFVQQIAQAAMPFVVIAQVFKALAYPTNGAIMGGLDWGFSAVTLWMAGAAGVGASAAATHLNVGSCASALSSLWLGLTAFFALQLVMGLARIISGKGPWRLLRCSSA